MNTSLLFLAVGVADVAPFLLEYAPLIGALSSIALGITGAYLIIHHTKKASLAVGVENYAATLADNAQGAFCQSCGCWNSHSEVEYNLGFCSLCGGYFCGPGEAEPEVSSPFEVPQELGWREMPGSEVSPFQLPEGYPGDPTDEDGDAFASDARLITGPECLTSEEVAAMNDPAAHAGEWWSCPECDHEGPSETFLNGANFCCPKCGAT